MMALAEAVFSALCGMGVSPVDAALMTHDPQRTPALMARRKLQGAAQPEPVLVRRKRFGRPSSMPPEVFEAVVTATSWGAVKALAEMHGIVLNTAYGARWRYRRDLRAKERADG